VRPLNALFLFGIRLRARIVQELLAVCGIAVGVALVFAALVASASLTGSVKDLTASTVGSATLQVVGVGPAGFDERLVERVRRTPGVVTAAPLLEAKANLVGPRGRRSVVLIGGDAEYRRLNADLLTHVEDDTVGGANGIALPARLADDLGVGFGQRLRVEIGARVLDATVGVRLTTAEVGDLVDHPVVLAPLSVAQLLAGFEGRVTRVLVRTRPGRDAAVADSLRRSLPGGVAVRAADAEVDIFALAAQPTNQSTALFSAFSALVGFLFAFSAVLLTVPQRRRFVRDLRIAGHDSSAVVQLLLLDALALAAVGSMLGLLLGDQLSRHLFDSAPGYLEAAFAFGTQRVIGWSSVAIAVGAGLAAALLAVFFPLRDIVAYRPLRRADQSRAPGDGEWWAALGGALFLLAASGLVVLAPDTAVPAIVMLTAALLLLLPALLRSTVAGCAWATRSMRSVVPTVALHELGSGGARARALAVAATGAVAVFATVAIGGAHADLERGLDASARDIDRNADIWISFNGQANILATTPFDQDPRLLERVRDVDDVKRVTLYRGGFMDIGDRRVWVLAHPHGAPMSVPPSQVLDGDPARAADRIASGGWMALSRVLADTLGVSVGERSGLDVGGDMDDVRVAAITTNLGWPPGAVMVNADDYRRAWGGDGVSAVHVDVAAGADPARVAAAVRRAVGTPSSLRVETAAERVERHYALTRQGLSRLTQISVLVLISAVLAMAVTLGGMIWQRRRSFAALKVQGFSERELWSALLMEATVLLAASALVGAAFGLYGQVLLGRALEAMTGFPVFYSAGLATAAVVLCGATVVAVAMLAVPGWLAVRVRPRPVVDGRA